MAKGKKKKSGKAAKLPKTIAGIELPEELRKQGAKLVDLIKHPLVGDLVAAGLVALAANVRGQDHTASAGARNKKDAGNGFGKTAATLATVVAARAAETITSKLTERPAPSADKPGPASDSASTSTATKPAAEKPAAKKPAASKSGTKAPRATTRKSATPRKPRAPKSDA